jgi:NADH-quinone oxidoreductase subunit J
MTAGSVLFAVCAALCLAGALLVVTAKNPIRSAMGLLTTIVGIAGLFLRLNAQFLAAMQILVYAGAVVILFVFVIMLLGPGAGADAKPLQRPSFSQLIAGGLVAFLGALAIGLIGNGDEHVFATIDTAHGSVASVGGRIFKQGLVPFELATALLLVAVVGAIAVARSRPSGLRPKAKVEENPTTRMFKGPVNRPGAAGAARENA